MKRIASATAVSMAMVLSAALAACTGSNVDADGLQPLTSDVRGDGAGNGAGLLPAPGSAAAAGSMPAGRISTGARIQFAPVIGATPEALPALSMRLAARAGQRGIPLAAEGASATHLVRGYFSAFTEDRETTIIYVWDVLTATGNRVHRIQGRQQLPAGSQQGWRSVTPAIMEAIADRTIDDMAAWLSTATG